MSLTTQELYQLLENCCQLPQETEWIEFKHNKAHPPEEIGEYISALSNSACLHNHQKGYLIWGIENETHHIVGTTFKPSQSQIGSHELENWLATQLNPRIDFVIHEFDYHSFPIVIFVIDAARTNPTKFKQTAYIRVGSYKKKLSESSNILKFLKKRV